MLFLLNTYLMFWCEVLVTQGSFIMEKNAENWRTFALFGWEISHLAVCFCFGLMIFLFVFLRIIYVIYKHGPKILHWTLSYSIMDSFCSSFMHLTDSKIYFTERFLTCYYKSSETKWLGMISKKGLRGG